MRTAFAMKYNNPELQSTIRYDKSVNPIFFQWYLESSIFGLGLILLRREVSEVEENNGKFDASH